MRLGASSCPILVSAATEPLQLVIGKAAGQGLLVLCLVVGIYAVSKLLAKTMEERVNDLKDRIAALEIAVKECESDRARLWQRLADDERHRTPAITLGSQNPRPTS